MEQNIAIGVPAIFLRVWNESLDSWLKRLWSINVLMSLLMAIWFITSSPVTDVGSSASSSSLSSLSSSSSSLSSASLSLPLPLSLLLSFPILLLNESHNLCFSNNFRIPKFSIDTFALLSAFSMHSSILPLDKHR